MTVTDTYRGLDLTRPNPDLVRAYGETYRTSYVYAYFSLPRGASADEQHCRSEIAHRYALDQCGRFHGEDAGKGFAALAAGYAVEMWAGGCAITKAAQAYARFFHY